MKLGNGGEGGQWETQFFLNNHFQKTDEIMRRMDKNQAKYSLDKMAYKKYNSKRVRFKR